MSMLWKMPNIFHVLSSPLLKLLASPTLVLSGGRPDMQVFHWGLCLFRIFYISEIK